MRATIIAAMSFAASLGLAGCDNSANVPAPTVQAVAPPCNCEPQNEAVTKTVAPRAKHRHARTASYREYEEDRSARSESRSTYQGGSGEQSDYQTAYQEYGHSEEAVWVDGYGRSHFVAAASAAPDDRARLAPWHGYDEDCDDKK
ncbi:MAG TPA: hypothetical protein VGC27_08595 [Rhizomicrobium sp.]